MPKDIEWLLKEYSQLIRFQSELSLKDFMKKWIMINIIRQLETRWLYLLHLIDFSKYESSRRVKDRQNHRIGEEIYDLLRNDDVY